jgi:hypothetical protein
MKKHLHLVLNGKGGVGKSFFAVNYVQYLKDKTIAHVAFDTDNENSTLKRFHPDSTFLNIADPRQLDLIFDTLATKSLAVVDCRAASTDLLFDHFTETGAVEVLAGLNTGLTFIMPVNHEADSVDQIQRVVEEFDARARYLILRNAVHSDSFAIYDGSEVRRKLLGPLDAGEITMTRLQPWLVESLNRTNISITQAVRHPEFSLLDRQRLIMWQRRLYEQIDSVAELLFDAPINEDKSHERPA